MAIIINMTPHVVTILSPDGDIVIPAAGRTIRLTSQTVGDAPLGVIPTSRTVYGEPEGLPEQADGVYYIVSQLVKTACPDRDDLLVPAEVVRDDAGNIVGCRSLGR